MSVRHVARARLSLTLVAIVGSAVAALAGGPSFDCATAHTAVDTAICRSERVSRLDVRIDAAYRRAWRGWAADGETRDALRAAQRDFLERRETALTAPYDGFVRHHEAQAALLEAIDLTPRVGFEGEWGKLAGALRIRREATGHVIWGGAVEPVLDRWICDLDALGVVAGATFVSPPGATTPDFPEWSVRIERLGAAIRVVEVSPPGTETLPDGSAAGQSPNCGRRGRFDGIYFPAKGLMKAK